MIELNNSIFYKVKFNIQALNEEVDLIWKVVVNIKTWLLRKYTGKIISSQNAVWSRLKKGGTLSSSDKKTLFIEAESFEESPEMVFWSCRVSEKQLPKSGYAPREWITEIGIRPIQKGCVEFSCVISYVDRPGFIGICEDEPFPNVPNLVKNILRDKECSCTIGCDEIAIVPHLLQPGDWLAFWEAVKSADRSIPYIFINAKENESVEADSALAAINPTQLAIAAGGNARVFYAKDLGIVGEMNFYCPEEYRCHAGSMRIYQPNVNLADPLDHRRHRYISANNIATLGEDKIIHMIRRALAQDIHFYETFFRVKDCRLKQEAAARQLRLAELKALHEQQNKEMEQEARDWSVMAFEEEEKRLKAEDALAQANEDLRVLKNENYNLSVEIDSYRPLAAKNAELERACNNRLNTKSYPSTPKDVIDYFNSSFGDCLAFSDEVEKSIKTCTIPLDELWSAFYHLATAMRDLYISGGAQIYKDFKQRTGIDVGRGEGANTHQNKKMMDQYRTEYHGAQIDIEAHIKCSRYQRIHFGFCPDDQKVIVGWCGEHKDNATTQKVR